MADSGKLEDDSSASLAETVEDNLFCQPCDKDGIRIKADGYCVECEEHLCITCFKYHTKPAPCRHHTLLDRDNMPKIQHKADPKPYDELDLCVNHNKRFEFYCKEHSLITCNVCITLYHRFCDVEYIPDVARNVTAGEEYRQLHQQMITLQQKCRTFIKKLADTSEEIETDNSEIVQGIKSYRKELNEYLDEIESKVLLIAEKQCEENKEKIQQMSAESEMIANEVVMYEQRFQQLESENKLNRLFTEMKTAKDHVQSLIEKESIKKVMPDRVDFVPNSVISETLSKQRDFGAIVQKGSVPSLRAVPLFLCLCDDVTIASSEKNVSLSISELVAMSSTVLSLIVDWRVVWLYDFQQRKVLTQQRFSELITSVTSIPEGKLAILHCDDKLIRVLSTLKYRLFEEKTIKTKEKYSSISHCAKGLIVTVNSYPGRVLLIDLYGNVLREIVNTESLYRPNFSVACADGEIIYVSDNKHSVTQMTLSGHILAIFREDGYFGARTIQELNDGSLIVRCYNTLLRISKNCSRLELRGLENVQSWNLRSLTYSKYDNKLYVVCADKENDFVNNIKVFDLNVCSV